MSAKSFAESTATLVEDEGSYITHSLSNCTHGDFCWSFRDQKTLNDDQTRLTGEEANALIDTLVKLTDGHHTPYRPDNDNNKVICASGNGVYQLFWPQTFSVTDWVTEVSFVPTGRESQVKTMEQHGFVPAPPLSALFRQSKL